MVVETHPDRVQESIAKKPKVRAQGKTKTLFYGRVVLRESNDPCQPEVKFCISQKLTPLGVYS